MKKEMPINFTPSTGNGLLVSDLTAGSICDIALDVYFNLSNPEKNGK